MTLTARSKLLLVAGALSLVVFEYSNRTRINPSSQVWQMPPQTSTVHAPLPVTGYTYTCAVTTSSLPVACQVSP